MSVCGAGLPSTPQQCLRSAGPRWHAAHCSLVVLPAGRVTRERVSEHAGPLCTCEQPVSRSACLQAGDFDVQLVVGDDAADRALMWTLAPALTLPPGAAGAAAAPVALAAARSRALFGCQKLCSLHELVQSPSEQRHLRQGWVARPAYDDTVACCARGSLHVTLLQTNQDMALKVWESCCCAILLSARA